ncbi:MAG TPA: AbrB/MazE/SpoVT family DNA-binding domain-containing protein [Acetobacteraceae bacterium]|jgi:antitoxin MazE|nr:AbrB/MazE/SpoVT family DNA-binding domain-containing protein [Acetobacteraceae bacterium]
MSQAIVGRWGKNLAIRIPLSVVKATGLNDGERVEIEVQDGDLVIRRPEARARVRSDAEAAAAEIMAESKRYTLGDITIRELLEEGRRG